MDKRESMEILNECMEWLENASSGQIEVMRKVYQEEKNSFFLNEEIEIILPSQMKVLQTVVEEKVDFPKKKIKPVLEGDGMIKYGEDEFKEINISECEDFAA